ncbi:MAG: hypothetical protein RL264_1815 [Bacteroidota bacterium]|jgi:predicted nucleotidyltransferase
MEKQEITGLSELNIEQIKQVIASFPEISKVLLFGSRAIGTYRPNSDIDLCLYGEHLNLTLLNRLEEKLDDLLLPYRFDLLVHSRIKNADFLEHIALFGKEF